MGKTRTLINEIYAAFNRRDVDGAVALMSEKVDWPKASEGGRVIGQEEIRSYWTRQWAEFDPHVEPIEVNDRESGQIDVKVHQIVKSLSGVVLSDQHVWHLFTMKHGVIERMDVKEDNSSFTPFPKPSYKV